MDIASYLSENYGFNRSITDSWSEYIDLWESWYAGKVKSFHRYNIYNGRRIVQKERLSLNMSKKCCEDWADLLFNPKCSVSVMDADDTKALNKILDKCDFWTVINKAVERTFAAGTGAIVTSVDNLIYNEDTGVINVSEAETRIEFIDAKNIYPISWDSSGHVTECAFAAQKSIRGKKYVFLSVNLINESGNYEIHNKVLKKSTGGTYSEADNISGSIDVFDTRSNIPWFAILKTAQNNNIDSDSPWGLSCYANSIDLLKAIDIGFDSFVNEINLGRKRIFVRSMLTTTDDSGTRRVFDDNDVAVYQLPESMDSKDLIQSENSDLRTAALKEYIQSVLSLFSAQVGFGKDKYDFDAVNMTTATQVISSNSDMFRRKKKNEIPLESALVDIVNAIIYASDTYGNYNINPEGLTIQFDDSVIEDTEAIAGRAMREAAAGLISPAEYRVRIFGESEETAGSRIKDIKENYPAMSDLIGE